MHISNRLGLREKAEQISNDLRSIANYEGRVPELMDQERVMQVTSVAALPKFRQLLEDLIVILLCAERYFNQGAGLTGGTLACSRSRTYSVNATCWPRRRKL
jgi:hypothetical protein